MSAESWQNVVRRGVPEPVELVVCPTCGAGINRPCSVGWGKRLAQRPHPKRRAEARVTAVPTKGSSDE